MSDIGLIWGYLAPINSDLSRINFSKDTPTVSVGRKKGNHVVLSNPTMSGKHCTITWDGTDSQTGGVVVTDLSMNGTFVNGQLVGLHKKRVLNDGNQIDFVSPKPGTTGGFTYHHVASRLKKEGLYEHYELGDELGRGAFAVVRKAIHIDSGTWYAIKMIAAGRTSFQATGKTPNTTLAREIAVMAQLQHQHICRLHEWFTQLDGSIDLVLEYVEGGDLMTYVSETSTGVDELTSRDICHQIVDAISYLHGKGVTHRDLKPQNILLTGNSPPFIKVADFGMAKVLDEATMLRTICGTPAYLAPEVLLDESGYDNAVDCWSVGAILFYMLTNKKPAYYALAQGSLTTRFRERVINWSHLERIDHPLSQEVKHFIRSLLVDQPQQRMSMLLALQHAWLCGHNPVYGRVQEHQHSSHHGAFQPVGPNPVSNMDSTAIQNNDAPPLRRSARLKGVIPEA